jgi:hypothetical protein
MKYSDKPADPADYLPKPPLDGFWAEIDRQLAELRTAKTADDVIRICPAVPGTSAGEGFFAGSGGDGQVIDALYAAGWTVTWREAHYYWVMRAPNGDLLTYVEGDLYRGDTHVEEGDR